VTPKRQHNRQNRYQSSRVDKDHVQLECHLCVFINALKRQTQTEQVRKDLAVLREAIEVMRRRSHLVLPSRRWKKEGILALLADETTPLSIDEIIEWASNSGLMLGRRRLHIQLSKMKRDGLIINPRRSFWTTVDRADEVFPQGTAGDWNTEQPARQRTQNGSTEYYCNRCAKYHLATKFWKNRHNLYGLQHYCKACQSEYQNSSLVERTTPA